MFLMFLAIPVATFAIVYFTAWAAVLYKHAVRFGGYLTMWNLKLDAILLIGFRMVSKFCIFSTLEIWSFLRWT